MRFKRPRTRYWWDQLRRTLLGQNNCDVDQHEWDILATFVQPYDMLVDYHKRSWMSHSCCPTSPLLCSNLRVQFGDRQPNPIERASTMMQAAFIRRRHPNRLQRWRPCRQAISEKSTTNKATICSNLHTTKSINVRQRCNQTQAVKWWLHYLRPSNSSLCAGLFSAF